MVCTRKKDYGEPPLKQRRSAPTQKVVIKEPDAAAAVGDDNQDESPNSHPDKQVPCSEFTLFPKLPAELRIEIWKASMTPRLLAVGPDKIGERRLQHRSTLPAQLSVNCESRECALRHFNLRLTISIAEGLRPPVHYRSRDTWPPPGFEHAHVVMSPDDTLGFYGLDAMLDCCCFKVRVQNANGIAPWDSESKPVALGAKPDLKKVALLGPDLAFNARILHDLNSTASWDLESILHSDSTRTRKIYPHRGPWYRLSEAAYSKDHVSVLTHKCKGSSHEWCMGLYQTFVREAVDILAFELGKGMVTPPFLIDF